MSKIKYLSGLVLAIILGILIGWSTIVLTNYINQNSLFKVSIPGDTFSDEIESDYITQEEIKSEIKPAEVKQVEPAKTITVTFVGDMMFDRYVRKWAEQNSYQDIFRHVREKLRKSDLVVGNLEGPVTNYETIYKHGSIPNNFTFTFDPKVANILYDANIKVVSIDNNHTFDYGRDGTRQTQEYLDSVGIAYFGNPDDRQILYHEVEGIRLAFLSYNQFILPDVGKLLQDIKIADQNSDYVIVFPHWGNEYEMTPTERQVSLAHQFIDSGADLVIGAHPHVIQTKEIYKGKYIYYSLGNFVFDQYFTEDVKCGAVVTFELDKNNVVNVREEFTKLSEDIIVEFADCFEFY